MDMPGRLSPASDTRSRRGPISTGALAVHRPAAGRSTPGRKCPNLDLMSYAKVLAVGLVGLVGHLVQVEADVAAGLPGLSVVGLPDAALNEARDRVRAALVNSGEAWPNKRITVNLL